ncbi:MAG: hypothetical protein KGR26_15455 [Cyanobacteria bacterium REEB65]|nr:hypothetical protein [Cyanobacteria bacterium REEB65]
MSSLRILAPAACAALLAFAAPLHASAAPAQSPAAPGPAAAAPKENAQMNEVARRLGSLTADQQSALRAVLWDDLKGKTMAQVYQQLDSWHQDSAAYAAYMSGAIDRAIHLSPQAAKTLESTVPVDFGQPPSGSESSR